jgi:hypothetical protein
MPITTFFLATWQILLKRGSLFYRARSFLVCGVAEAGQQAELDRAAGIKKRQYSFYILYLISYIRFFRWHGPWCESLEGSPYGISMIFDSDQNIRRAPEGDCSYIFDVSM